jgi:hypothetical protein
MAVVERTMYVAVCDGCGAKHETEDWVAWTDADSAVEVALNSEWWREDDGRLLCWDCHVEANREDVGETGEEGDTDG